MGFWLKHDLCVMNERYVYVAVNCQELSEGLVNMTLEYDEVAGLWQHAGMIFGRKNTVVVSYIDLGMSRNSLPSLQRTEGTWTKCEYRGQRVCLASPVGFALFFCGPD